MDKPALSGAQQKRLTSFAEKIAKRDPAPEMVLFLCEVRELMLVARVEQKALAARIAQIVRRPPPGEALPGHTLGGQYRPQRMSDELNLRDGRWPHVVVIDAVAQLYVERIGRPDLDEVYAHLRQLRQAAVVAQGQRRRQRADEALQDGRREPGVEGRRRLSKERDQARAEAAALTRRLEVLESVQERSDADDAARSTLLVQLTVLIYRLQDQLVAVRAELEEVQAALRARDAQVSESEQRNAEQWRQIVAGQAQIDQLDAEVADLRRRLGRTWSRRVRQLLTPESGTPTQKRPELGGREQERLDGVVEELLDAELGSGSSGVATAVRPVVLPAAVRGRVTTAAVVLLAAGLALTAWLAPVFPGPAATHLAFQQCMHDDDVVATDQGKPRQTLLQTIGLIGIDETADSYYIVDPGLAYAGSVTFAFSPSQARAIVLQQEAFDTFNDMSDWFDNKVIGDNVVVSTMIKPLHTSPHAVDVVTTCATTHS